MRKIYSYIFYRTHQFISEGHLNPLNLAYRTARLLALLLFSNILSIAFLFEDYITKQSFKIVLIVAMVLFISISLFVNDRQAKKMIQDSESLKVSKIWEFAVDYYPHFSLLFFLVSIKASMNTFLVGYNLHRFFQFPNNYRMENSQSIIFFQ